MTEEDNRRLAIRDRVGALRTYLKRIEDSMYAASRELAKLEEVLKEAEIE